MRATSEDDENRCAKVPVGCFGLRRLRHALGGIRRATAAVPDRPDPVVRHAETPIEAGFLRHGTLDCVAATPLKRAIDQVLRSSVAPAMRAAGFRKKGWHWSHRLEEAARAVSVQGSRWNTASSGRFTMEFGFAYPGIGEAVPTTMSAWFFPHRYRIGTFTPDGLDLWWEIGDAQDAALVDAVAAGVERDFLSWGLPVVEAGFEPKGLRDRVVGSRHAYGFTLLKMVSLSIAMGDVAGAQRDMRRALDRTAAIDTERYPLGERSDFYLAAADLGDQTGFEWAASDKEDVAAVTAAAAGLRNARHDWERARALAVRFGLRTADLDRLLG